MIELFRFTETDETGRARLRVFAKERSPHPVNPLLFGKFCEHLGSNIYGGMHAQILRNSTFGAWVFGGGDDTPDGGAAFTHDRRRIEEMIRSHHARRFPGDAAALLEARADGLAFPWVRRGAREDVRVSPDSGPHGGRAQRIEVKGSGEGIAQWVYLPLHRVRSFEYRLVARSPATDPLPGLALALGLGPPDETPLAMIPVEDLGHGWRTFTGTIELGDSADAEALYEFSLTAPCAGSFVVDRLLLYPSDHVNGNDPDVIRLLREARLPILRWPGGNFVSGYRWEPGVGPLDARPTVPNPAWGGLEYNLFGTDEFLEFCRQVGCEPLICVNAGDGTPEEAARWVEYANGGAETHYGKKRAENGHPEPYEVKYWEIGNELSGRHQIGWTTPSGYLDRFRLFAGAMRAVDPRIVLLANGAPPWFDPEWNRRLIEEAGEQFRIITDHILVGGRHPPETDPLALFRDFMYIPVRYGQIYREWRERMLGAGFKDPRLAVTELQLFARLERGDDAGRLNRETFVTPATLAEALYDALFYHESVRMGEFIEMITHSATVNHGGGLRKERERLYANPCHYGQAMFAKFAGATPVAVELECASERTDGVIEMVQEGERVAVLDALAALKDGRLIISLVHRGTRGPVELEIELRDFDVKSVKVVRLSGEHPASGNSLEEPERIVPRPGEARVENGRVRVDLPPYSLSHVELA